MTDKGKKYDRRSVAPTRVHETATNPNAKNQVPEERVMTPLHRRVSTYAVVRVACGMNQDSLGSFIKNTYINTHKCICSAETSRKNVVKISEQTFT
jgi:hypothetical protein